MKHRPTIFALVLLIVVTLGIVFWDSLSTNQSEISNPPLPDELNYIP